MILLDPVVNLMVSFHLALLLQLIEYFAIIRQLIFSIRLLIIFVVGFPYFNSSVEARASLRFEKFW